MRSFFEVAHQRLILDVLLIEGCRWLSLLLHLVELLKLDVDVVG